MKGRFRTIGQNNRPDSQDQNVYIDASIDWPSHPAPQVRLEIRNEGNSRSTIVFMSADQARSLGARLLSEGDKVFLACRDVKHALPIEPHPETLEQTIRSAGINPNSPALLGDPDVAEAVYNYESKRIGREELIRLMKEKQ